MAMFVLPPPPRYPAHIGPGGVGALLETNNILTHPTGPEYQLVVGEGTYVLRDSLQLAVPPPHPSEAQPKDPNPLATTPNPPTAGTKLSPTALAPKQRSYSQLYKIKSNATNNSSLSRRISENPNESQATSTDITPFSGSNSTSALLSNGSPAFGEGNPALTPATTGKHAKDPNKRGKPKNNIVKSNSSFVSRVIPNEALPKKLQERDPSGTIAFVNVNRAFQWLDLASSNKQEHLTKILFTKAHCLCHDLNPVTRNTSHIDIVMGFSTADIIWWEVISQKYSRLNKNGCINQSPVSDIRWLPGSENLFLAAHMDGTLVVYDKEKEDTPFVAEEQPNGVQTNGHHSHGAVGRNLEIKKSVQSKNQKFNPVACWKTSNSKINQFALSPDGRHLAVVSEDGTLRIIDYLREKLLDVFTSYYGGISCVCWSPDGRYIVTGGQDDLVSIWSLEDSTLIARAQGHNSWVTYVAFDPWRCDDRNYRFGSVGDDCKLLLWDFNVGMLHRPKAAVNMRASVSSGMLVGWGRGRTESMSTAKVRGRSESDLTTVQSGTLEKERSNGEGVNGEEYGDGDFAVHPVEPRARVAALPPVMAKQVDDHPLSWLGFEEDCIITACKEGQIRTWDRPKEGSGAGDANGVYDAASMSSR